MEKKITIKIDNNRTIKVQCEQREVSILSSNRTINALEIYNLFDFHSGDIFNVELSEEPKIDAPAVNQLVEMLNKISTSLNSLEN